MTTEAGYMANSLRRALLAMAAVALTLVLAGVIGPRASAQGLQPIDPSWAALSLQVQGNLGDIAQLKRSVEKIEAGKIPERMALIEYKLDKIEWLSNSIVIGLIGLMLERFWPRRKTE